MQNILSITTFTLLFSISTALSITLLGDRNLISGNLLSLTKMVSILTNWKFILSMSLAVLARFSFVMLNNSLLKVDRLAASSTTISSFITCFAFVFIVASNVLFLDEKLSVQQGVGAIIIICGVFTMMH